MRHVSYINGSPGPGRHGLDRSSGPRCNTVCPCRPGPQGSAALVVIRFAPATLARRGPRPSLYHGVTPTPLEPFGVKLSSLKLTFIR